MAPIPLVLMVFAFVCFVIATFPPPQNPNWNRLVSAGLAFWALTLILGYTGVLGR